MTSSLKKVLDWIELKQKVCISLLATARIKKAPSFHHAKKDGHSRRYTPRVKVAWLKWIKETRTVPFRLKGWNSMIKQWLGMKNRLRFLKMHVWKTFLKLCDYKWSYQVSIIMDFLCLIGLPPSDLKLSGKFCSFLVILRMHWTELFLVCMQWPLWHYWWC